ncbi:hypothetical protein BLBA0010001c01_00009 [Bifidobacterium phage BlindBasel1]|nr:hypothetical protein BLBA0010001c01_00009 [Bifidobacterium phage BlindBasel1]
MTCEQFKLRTSNKGEQTITVKDGENPVTIASRVSARLKCAVTLIDPDDNEDMLTIEVI